MRLKLLFAAVALLGPAPVLAQATQPAAERNAKNWDVFQQLYPPRAILAREEGLVGFKVKIDGTGSPRECQVTHSSGHPLLDQETCQLVMLHATFKRPDGVSSSQQRVFEGTVNWRLPTTPASKPLTAPTQIAAGAGPEKVICKRVKKTGSNAAFERTCLTEREWKRATDESREPWDEMQGRKGSTSGN